MRRYGMLAAAMMMALLVGTLRSGLWSRSVPVSGAPEVNFLPPPATVRESRVGPDDAGAPPELVPPEPRTWITFPAPSHQAGADREALKLLNAWGINDQLMFETEGVWRAASREAVRATAAFFAHRPGQFPRGEIGLAIPVTVVHYFPARPGADLSVLIQVRTPAGGIYLLERDGTSWRALPILEEESPGLAKAVELRDIDGDEILELVLYGQGGSGPALTVTILSNPAAPQGARTLWRSEPILHGSARFVAQEGARAPLLQIEQRVTGALIGSAAMPEIRERYLLRWSDGQYRLQKRQRFASRLCWLSWLLEAASRGDWEAAARAIEPETLREAGRPARWFPTALRGAKLPAVWRDELGAATVFEAPPSGHWLVEYGPTGRIRRLQPFER